MKGSAKFVAVFFTLASIAAAVFVIFRYMDELKKHFVRLQGVLTRKMQQSCDCEECSDDVEEVDDVEGVVDEGDLAF